MQKHFDKIYKHFGLNTRRETNIKKQKQGIDLYLNIKDNNIIVDEKAATSNYNRDLRTFAFELEFTKTHPDGSQTRYLGWFNEENRKILTDVYMLGYVRADENNNFMEKIDTLEVIMIKKSRLWKYIRQLGYNSSDDLINTITTAHREGTCESYNNRYGLNIGRELRLVYSPQMQEAPINIIFSKYILKKLSSAIYKLSYDNSGNETYICEKQLVLK